MKVGTDDLFAESGLKTLAMMSSEPLSSLCFEFVSFVCAVLFGNVKHVYYTSMEKLE